MSVSRPIDRAPLSLRSILKKAVFIGAEDIQVRSCHRSASRVVTGSVFVTNVEDCDSDLDQVELAIASGAQAIITERLLPFSVPQCLVSDTRQAYSEICHELAGRPCDDLLTIGVMGTHGKTTTSLLIASMLKSVGGRVGYYTSLGASDGIDSEMTANSRASANQICRWLAKTRKQQSPAAVLELTESMLTSRSSSGLQFDVLVIPGLRPSHRSSTLERRGHETAMLAACDQLKGHGVVIYNADDARLNQWVKERELPAIGYGLDAEADVCGQRRGQEIGCQNLMVSAGPSLMPLESPLIGDHHARHLLAAVTTGYAFGLELHEIIGGVERMKKIPGRMQRVDAGQDFSVYVDLADQADRLAVALHGMRKNNPSPIICVAEVPDVMDAASRAAYGRVLERAASRVILTQSRRTTAGGQAAMWEVLDGCERPASVQLVPNRAAGIELALRAARPGEQVLLAGWGANTWTTGNDRRIRQDFECATKLLQDVEPVLSRTQEAGKSLRVVRD